MIDVLYRGLFSVLECPNVKLRWPWWLRLPEPMTVFAMIMVSYFLVTGGTIFNVINEPPSLGQTMDEHTGKPKVQAFMVGRVNAQYILEGLSASFMFIMGSVGFILLDKTNQPEMPKLNRYLLLGLSGTCILVAYCSLKLFMRIKLPGYMS